MTRGLARPETPEREGMRFAKMAVAMKAKCPNGTSNWKNNVTTAKVREW